MRIWIASNPLSSSYNDALRLAQSVCQCLAGVVGLLKLAESGFNCTFLVTLRDGLEIARAIPQSRLPKRFDVTALLAMIEYMRAAGRPVPKIYGYAPDADNAARTAYILMERLRGLTARRRVARFGRRGSCVCHSPAGAALGEDDGAVVPRRLESSRDLEKAGGGPVCQWMMTRDSASAMIRVC
jgi:hypothetical protein